MNRWTEKRTGGHPPVLFLPVLSGCLFALCFDISQILFCSALVLAAVIDHYSTEIPDRCSLVILLAAMIHGFSMEGMLAMVWMIPVACVGSLGWGDVKLMLSAGAYLGFFPVWMAVSLSFWTATAVELAKKNRRKQIPLAPWLAAGCLISLFCGNYLSL